MLYIKIFPFKIGINKSK